MSKITNFLKIHWFQIILTLTYQSVLILCFISNIGEFSDLSQVYPKIFTDNWKLFLYFLNIIFFIVLFFNICILKAQRLQIRLKLLLMIVAIFITIFLSFFCTFFTISTINYSGNYVQRGRNTHYENYQTKYSIQQIQLATVILSLPSLYAIIMIILTNYYWQKPVKD